ncbi:MAG: MBL fold metallo-hydrolase [bacterium]|nr:MBL fold metallo-hydrolase [bacterium]
MFSIDSYTLEPLVTGTFALDGGAMFGVVPKVLWNSKIASDELNRIPLSLRSLLIRGEGKIILIDVGIGDKWSPKLKEMYSIQPLYSPLENALLAKGIQPSQVTDVIVTHLHFDHVGGATKYDTNHKLMPTLPNAKVYVQKSNWKHAETPNEKDRASYLQENYLPLYDAGLVVFVEGNQEILPGIQVIETNGHTIGQQLVKIGEGKHSVLYCADMIPTSAHLPLAWVMGYDLYPLTTIEEKKKWLPKAAKEEWILFFEHDPFLHSCTIEWNDKGPLIKDVYALT